MKTRNCIFFFLLAFLTFGSVDSQAKGIKKKPNILWIVAEDLSPYMGCYGDEINKGHTPTIDRLAASGVRFERAYAPAPVCSACRSAFITGVMQTTTGVHEHRSSRTTDGEVVPEKLRIYLPDGMKTIPELMKKVGYFTFNSGKDDYNFFYNRLDLYDVGNSKDYKPGMNGWQGNHAEHNLSITEDVWNSRTDKSQPWFGQIEIMGGKRDYKYVRKGEKLAPNDVPLPPYFPNIPSQREAWTTHYNANRGSDVRVEAILDQLEKDGELENTIVFFFSDHGSPTSLRHKQFCYEEGLQVPLIISGKGIDAGVVRTELVSLLDVSATTLALAGAELPKYLDGQDLFSKRFKEPNYIVGARDRCDFTIDRIRTIRTDKYRYLRNFFPDRPIMQPGYRDLKPIVVKLKEARDKGQLTAYQNKFWFGERPEEELYDMEVDPFQMNNLAKDSAFAKVLKKHRAYLDNWVKKTNDKGQYLEDKNQLKATYDLWKDRPQFKNAKVNPEYDPIKLMADE